MIPAAAREVLESDALAHFTTLDESGAPYVTLAWVGIEDERIVIATLGDQKKLANVRRDPRVSLSLVTGKRNDFGLDEYLKINGTAEVTEGGAPELLQKLAHTYLGPDVKFPPMPNPPPGFVTRITVEKIGGVGPWTGG